MKDDTPDRRRADPRLWIDQHGDYLFRFALLRVGDPPLAEDLLQEALLSALKSIDGFNAESSERTWLTTILRNKIVDHFRRKPKVIPVDFADPGPEAEYFRDGGDFSGHWKDDFAPVDWGPNPLDTLERKEFYESFMTCLRRLPPATALIFSMREIEGLSTAEICKELEISASNVWVSLHRARIGLRQCVELRWFRK